MIWFCCYLTCGPIWLLCRFCRLPLGKCHLSDTQGSCKCAVLAFPKLSEWSCNIRDYKRPPHIQVGCLNKSTQGDAGFFPFTYCSQFYDKPNLGKASAVLPTYFCLAITPIYWATFSSKLVRLDGSVTVYYKLTTTANIQKLCTFVNLSQGFDGYTTKPKNALKRGKMKPYNYHLVKMTTLCR